jgi:GGDEF domain-containing protein
MYRRVLSKLIVVTRPARSRLAQAISPDYLRELTTDPVTGVSGRYHYHEAVKRANNDPKLAVAMFDVDNLKGVNDNVGYPVGDRVLRDATQVMLEVAEKYGLGTRSIIRMGGDEFVVIVRIELAEELCSKTVDLFGERSYNGEPVSLSCGWGNTSREAEASMKRSKAESSIRRRTPSGLI